MSTTSGQMWVSVGDKFACVKICGRANFTSSLDFRALVCELQARGLRYFILDLTDCALMDSTFLGVLAGFGLKAQSPDGSDGQFELFHPNPRIVDLLENLGVLHLFKVNSGPLDLPGEVQAQSAAAPCNATKEEVTRTCLEAHKTLMEANPDNVSRFKDVTAFLAEELKKSTAA